MFRQLVEYKIMHGNFNNVEQHEALGKWAAGQKYLLEMGKMNQIRMLRFMAIGFCNSEMDSLMFAKYIAKLQATKAKDGSCDYASLEQPALAIFCAVQRYLLKKGTLSQERKQRLQSIGFNVKDFQPLHLPLPESRYVSRESSIVSLKTMVKTDDKKITHPKKTLKQKIDEAFDDSTVSSKNSDGNTTLDTTLDTSMDSSASSPQKELRQRENEGFLGLLAIAMEWKG